MQLIYVDITLTSRIYGPKFEDACSLKTNTIYNVTDFKKNKVKINMTDLNNVNSQHNETSKCLRSDCTGRIHCLVSSGF